MQMGEFLQVGNTLWLFMSCLNYSAGKMPIFCLFTFLIMFSITS
jgi:hypothetical protein